MLHDTIKRIYDKIRSVTSIEVLSEDGWEDVKYVSTTPKQEVVKIRTSAHELVCSKDHILIKSNEEEVLAKDSLGCFLKTNTGYEKVLEVKNLKRKMKLYDLSLGGENHTYYTNGIISHNCLILDEFAFLPKNVEDKLFASVYPVISQDPNGKIFLISTPNGTNNLFYKIWTQANSKDTTKNLDGWKPFQMFYWQVPGHDTPEWKEAQIAAIGEQRFQQEFNCQFISSDQVKKLIPEDITEKYKMKYSEYKKNKTNLGKELAVYSQDGKKEYTFRMFYDFDPNKTYLCSSDISEGIGKDSSVLYIWDITETSNIKMCLKFSSNQISILEFAYLTNKILKMYANPFISCESNGISLGYIDQLRTVYGYENFVRLNRDNGCGIQSHVSIKSKACLWFRDMMTTLGFGFELPDLDLIDEFTTFVKKDSTRSNIYAALGDNHDDHLMAMVWACYILHPENIEKYYVVADTFTSSLGNIYPKNIQPLEEYTTKEVNDAMKDPVYRDFQTYKEVMKEEYARFREREELENMNDTYQFMNPSVKLTPGQVLEMKRQKQLQIEAMREQNQPDNGLGRSAGMPMFTDGDFGSGFGYEDWGGGTW